MKLRKLVRRVREATYYTIDIFIIMSYSQNKKTDICRFLCIYRISFRVQILELILRNGLHRAFLQSY